MGQEVNVHTYVMGDSLCCSLPVPLSLADTLTMPLASMSNETSICGTPLGAGGIPTYSHTSHTSHTGREIRREAVFANVCGVWCVQLWQEV